MILGLSSSLSIIISAAVSVAYTLIGGFFSVAFTDAIQLAVLVLGLVKFCLPIEAELDQNYLITWIHSLPFWRSGFSCPSYHVLYAWDMIPAKSYYNVTLVHVQGIHLISRSWGNIYRIRHALAHYLNLMLKFFYSVHVICMGTEKPFGVTRFMCEFQKKKKTIFLVHQSGTILIRIKQCISSVRPVYRNVLLYPWI